MNLKAVFDCYIDSDILLIYKIAKYAKLTLVNKSKTMSNNNYYNLSLDEVLLKLNSSLSGLSSTEAAARLVSCGANVLPEKPVPTRLQTFFAQFLSPLIAVLIVAALVIFLTGDLTDALIIFFVIIFNAVVGTIQEGKAQNTLQALKNFVSTSATVLRAGQELVIPDYEVVPGDIIYLSEGDKIPADARLVSANFLKVDESSFTGESLPAKKTAAVLKGENLLPQNLSNMIFKGTNVAAGNACAIVVVTGLETEIGKISQKISSLDTDIPLKSRIEALSKLIILLVFGVGLVIVFAGVLFGRPLNEMFVIAVSLAVAVIPEGLPVVMTLILASGVWRMTKRQVLVKKLQAVEALGQASIIAVDKTGTLTRNEMVVRNFYIDGRYFAVSGDGYNPVGDIYLANQLISPLDDAAVNLLARIAGFGASAQAAYNQEKKIWKTTGDPTEVALSVFAKKVGFKNIEAEAPLTFEIPFDYSVKYHLTIRSFGGNNFMSLSGAPEAILEKCTKIFKDGLMVEFTDSLRAEIDKQFIAMSTSGLRVIACAYQPQASATTSLEALPELCFAGFLGMKDALRAEVKDTVAKVIAAGMRVVVITGDHPITALAIAKEAGIILKDNHVITGAELDELSDLEILERFAVTNVFARVTPAHKLRIIELFRRRGETVAMTGDGINDAPSLAAADLGVAMGGVGTEVAKEAADIILLDDNFSNLVSAAEEGRSIYKTIEKVVLYLFSTSFGELLIISSAVFFNWPLPLIAAQIIWLNFVTDGFLDVSLAMERKEAGLLNQKIEKPAKYILGKLSWRRLLVMSLIMATSSLALFAYYLEVAPEKALTISLSVLAVSQWFNAWNCKSNHHSIFSKDFISNKWLIFATLLVIGLQLLAVYLPFLQGLLRTTALNTLDWFSVIAVASLVIWPEELRKLLYRRQLKLK